VLPVGPEPISPGLAIKPGDILAGKYQVERTLGIGGMGVVVAARHIAVQHRVALKFLLPGTVPGRVAAARFLREAQNATAIQSEHVVRVVDLGTLENGAPFLVMEYLDGLDLARLLALKGPFDPASAVGYVLQALVALAEAHAIGIVHRDLKPSNLFLTERSDGAPLIKVLDFGISKAMSSEFGPRDSLTRSGGIVGSPSYMAPEQIRSSKHADARTDIWAIGVILQELVTGRTPFIAEQVSGVLAAIVADHPTAPRALTPGVPRGLEQVILKCLEKDPRNRYASVRDLAQALGPFAPPEMQELVGRIAAITARKSGRVEALTRLDGSPPDPDAGRLSRTGGAWTKSLALGSGRFGARVRIALGLCVVALGAVVLLRTFDDSRVTASKRLPVEPAISAASAPELSAPSAAVASAGPTSTRGVSSPSPSPPIVAPLPEVVAAPAPQIAPPPAASIVKKKRAPRRTPKPSAATSGNAPRPVSEIVLDRR
jgi:eukaryotic-like serine/threonine-protein kinase